MALLARLYEDPRLGFSPSRFSSADLRRSFHVDGGGHLLALLRLLRFRCFILASLHVSVRLAAERVRRGKTGLHVVHRGAGRRFDIIAVVKQADRRVERLRRLTISRNPLAHQ